VLRCRCSFSVIIIKLHYIERDTTIKLYLSSFSLQCSASRRRIAETSRIDVLVNNAGYALNGAFEDLAMEELKAQYETNLFGVTRVTQAALSIIRKQKSGIIVNISSGGVTLGGIPG